MHNIQTTAQQVIDITDCDKEPIHLTQLIQSHGILFVLDQSDLSILQVSANTTTFFDKKPEELIGKNLATLFREEEMAIFNNLREIIGAGNKPVYIGTFSPANSTNNVIFDAVAHFTHQGLILELELLSENDNILPEPAELYGKVFSKLLNAFTVEEFSQTACEQIRKMTGYDRVMVYKFDEDESGDVIAEDLEPGVDSFLGLHYPASDIPKQARALYKKNWTRIISDINSQPAPLYPQINPRNDEPLDQSNCILRSLSPVHVEYLRNMQVVSSMSISIIVKGRLWGLISCHHQTPKYVAYKTRMTCEFLGQILSSQLGNIEESEVTRFRNEVYEKQQNIIIRMARERDFIRTFYDQGIQITDLVKAEGAAFCFEGNYSLFGETPSKLQVEDIVRWLKARKSQDIFATNSLSACYPEAEAFKDVASGVLALAISHERGDYFLWFRPEMVQTVNWAGDPRKPAEVDRGHERLTPRKSFDLWKETVRGKALAWTQGEIEAIHSFRNAVLNVILSQTIDELSLTNLRLSQSNQDLENFATIASHDMQAPLRKAKLFTDQVMEEMDKLKPENRDALLRAQKSIDHLQTLINDVLTLARVNKASRSFEIIEIPQVLDRVITTLEPVIQEKGAKIESENLKTIVGDPLQIEQLLQNLIENGLKYQQPGQTPIIKLRMDDCHDFLCQLEIEDNGIGFKSEQAERIFEPFERLHSKNAYPGTGIGLSICKRIVERHGGRITATGKPGAGAKFVITIPNRLVS